MFDYYLFNEGLNLVGANNINVEKLYFVYSEMTILAYSTMQLVVNKHFTTTYLEN